MVGPALVVRMLEWMGNGFGPVYSSTGSVEMLLRVQKLYKTGHVTESQRIQCSCALDPSLTRVDVTSSEKAWNSLQAIGNIAFAYSSSNVFIEIQASQFL